MSARLGKGGRGYCNRACEIWTAIAVNVLSAHVHVCSVRRACHARPFRTQDSNTPAFSTVNPAPCKQAVPGSVCFPYWHDGHGQESLASSHEVSLTSPSPHSLPPSAALAYLCLLDLLRVSAACLALVERLLDLIEPRLDRLDIRLLLAVREMVQERLWVEVTVGECRG